MSEGAPPADLTRPIAAARLAAAAMALSLAFIAGLGVLDFVHGEAPIGMWNAFAVLATALAAAGVWKRLSLAHAPALVVCWHNALWSALWATRGLTLLWLACGASAAGAFALSVSRKAFPGLEPPRDETKEATPGLWLKENSEAILVALIMALLIRCFCIEVFKIPSSSMEPTLLGDITSGHPREGCPFKEYHVSDGGDRIMATKYFYAFSAVQRFDVVVFKSPLNQSRTLIKRVVGLPSEEFFLERGNIYTRPAGDANAKYRIARKPLRTQQAIWIHDLDPGLTNRESFDAVWREENGRTRMYEVDRGTLRTLKHGESKDAKNANFRYRPPGGPDGLGQEQGELSVAFDVELRDKTGEFFVVIPNSFGRFTLRLSPEQPCQIERRTSTDTDTTPLRTVRLEPERRMHVEFMVYDGTALALIDGQMEAELRFGELHDKLGKPEPTDNLAFEARGLLFTLGNLQLGRDIYYRDKEPPRRLSLEGSEHAVSIPADCYMMMGDNVPNSHDVRGWVEEVFELTDDAARRLGVTVTEEMKKQFGGPVIRCEQQERTNAPALEKERWWKERGLEGPPDYYIPADDIGYERGFNEADVKSRVPRERAFWWVDRKYLVGKALWIWFPPGRWFRIIR